MINSNSIPIFAYSIVTKTKSFCDRTRIDMDAIIQKIDERIRGWNRGRIFFGNDFADLATSDAIRQSLGRLAKEGKILRIARGIYCYPRKLNPMLGEGMAMPSLDEIAKAVAKRDNMRIAPTGDHALNWLGLSTQVPCNAVYWTDGTARRINIGKGRGILFKHSTSMDNFAYRSELMQLIVLAMKGIGAGKIRDDEQIRINTFLQKVELNDFKHDIKLAPTWIQDILIKNYEIR